jgi:hypothetical protein
MARDARASEVPPYPLIQSSAAHDRRRALIVSLILLTTLAVLSAIGPLYRAQFLAEVDVNEGWNAYHVDAVLHGLPLYPSPDLLITNNYPPLYYYLVAGLSSIFGDTIFIGRALSFIAVLAVGAEIFLILRRLAVGQRPAFAAAVAYFATMCRLFDGRVAVNDPQLLAHAIVGLGLLLFLIEREGDHRWFVLSASTMVLAGFVKHNVVAVPAATFLFLLLEDRKSAARFAAVGLGMALGGLWLCALAYGPSFAFNILEPRPYHLLRGIKSLEDLHRVPVQFILWVGYALWCKDQNRGRLINLLCLAGLAESFGMRTAEEVDRNASYDLLFALHLAFGAVLERANDIRPRALSTSAYQAVLIAATTARLLFGEPMDSFNVLINPAIVQYFRDAEAATLADVERVRRIPGPVFCESPYTCFMAGKPFVVDGINLQFRVTMGREPCDVIDRLLESGELTYVPSRTGSPNLRPYRFVLPLAYRLEENRENVTAPVSQISCGRRPAYKLQISFAAQDAIDQTPRR